jgi:hypothetical protein
VRQGASWTAASHLQLTVPAMARPIRSSGVPSASLLLSGPGCRSPRRRFARRSVQPVSRARASSPWSTRPAGTLRRRSPVSSRRCPPIRFRRPGSGCPAVRCPVTWAGRPEGPAVGRLLSTRPASSRPLSSRAVSSRPVSSRPSGRVRLLPPQAVALGTRSSWPGDRDHRNRWRPRWLPSRRRLERRSRRPGCGRRCPSRGGQWAVAGGPGPLGWCGPRRPRLPAERPGRPGRRAERPSRAAALWAREQTAARAGCIRRVAGVLGWVRDHGEWSSPSLTPGWAAPGGVTGGAGGDGWAAPARPKLAASAPRSRPAAL